MTVFQSQERRLKVGVIAAGIGNINGVTNMFNLVPGANAEVCGDPTKSSEFDLLVLPGVGSFDHGMQRLVATGWQQALSERQRSNNLWTMGICLGMQLLCESSEEGSLPGLNLVPGRFERLQTPRNGTEVKVPHMGWNTIEVTTHPPILGWAFAVDSRFYFVHSYHYLPVDAPQVVGLTHYAGPVVAAIEYRNCFGVQFHPEKSHVHGLNMLGEVVRRLLMMKSESSEGL